MIKLLLGLSLLSIFKPPEIGFTTIKLEASAVPKMLEIGQSLSFRKSELWET